MIDSDSGNTPSSGRSIRDAAEALRTAMPRRESKGGGEAPKDTGKRLATLQRGPDEELRVSWSEFEGRPFLNLRVWKRDSSSGQWWPDKTKGCTIRLRELATFADGLAVAMEEASKYASEKP